MWGGENNNDADDERRNSGAPTMTSINNTAAALLPFVVYNQDSGLTFGTYFAADAEGAIKAMLADAGAHVEALDDSEEQGVRAKVGIALDTAKGERSFTGDNHVADAAAWLEEYQPPFPTIGTASIGDYLPAGTVCATADEYQAALVAALAELAG
jgi:hypothetical protein